MPTRTRHRGIALFVACVSVLASIAATRAFAEANAAAPNRRVLIVSIDGLRPDLALLADMPNLRSLMRDGAYTMWAQTIPIGKTLPSHTSMMTGVPLETHGVFWNEDIPLVKLKYEHPQVPTLFDRAKAMNYTTAVVAGKYKFVAFARPGPPAAVDYLVLPERPKLVDEKGKPLPPAKRDADGMTEYDRKYSDDWVAREAAKVIHEHQPQVMMVHLPRADSAGHAKNWGSPQQLGVIAMADEALGVVLKALRDEKLFDDTLIIVTADHGGFGKNHDGKDPRGLHIPWVAHGPGVKKGYDLTQQKTLVVSTMDTFATAARYLGLPISDDDHITGKAVVDAFESAATPATK